MAVAGLVRPGRGGHFDAALMRRHHRVAGLHRAADSGRLAMARVRAACRAIACPRP